MSLRATLRGRTHDEYVSALADAKMAVDDALRASTAHEGRAALKRARDALHVADTRLSSHAGPPA